MGYRNSESRVRAESGNAHSVIRVKAIESVYYMDLMQGIGLMSRWYRTEPRESGGRVRVRWRSAAPGGSWRRNESLLLSTQGRKCFQKEGIVDSFECH